jgi:hypothetical protein
MIDARLLNGMLQTVTARPHSLKHCTAVSAKLLGGLRHGLHVRAALHGSSLLMLTTSPLNGACTTSSDNSTCGVSMNFCCLVSIGS